MNLIYVLFHQQSAMKCFIKHLLIQNRVKLLNLLTIMIPSLFIIRWKQKAMIPLDGNILKKVLMNGRSESSKPKNKYLGSQYGSLFYERFLNASIFFDFQRFEAFHHNHNPLFPKHAWPKPLLLVPDWEGEQELPLLP